MFRTVIHMRSTVSVLSSIRMSTRTASSASPNVVVDQTRKDNDPNAGKEDSHKDHAKSADDREGLDEQQKGNPQPTPSRSTGIETKRSDGGKAGGGKTENVHTETDAGPNMTGFDKK